MDKPAETVACFCNQTKDNYPAICTHPGLSAKTREILEDLWQNAPLPTRRQSVLPASEWASTIDSFYWCWVNLVGQDTVLLSSYNYYQSPDDWTPPDERPEFKAFVGRHLFRIDFDPAITTIPANSSTIHVSKECLYHDAWAIFVGALVSHELDPPVIIHTRQSLIENGLSLTDGYVNEISYWLNCTVLAQHRTGKVVELLTEIESVIWNQPLDEE